MKVMIQDLTISYVCNGIKTTLTIEDEHYDNMPYKLADMFEKEYYLCGVKTSSM